MKDHGFITKDRPVVPADPWAAVEAECLSHRARGEHAGRLHVLARGGVLCVAWRPLVEGERASDAWIGAAGRSGSEVPDAREALYPPPATIAFQLDTGRELDAAAERTAPVLRAYYERVLRPVRRRRTVEFA